MTQEQISSPLQHLLEQHPPEDAEKLWEQAAEAAWSFDRPRGAEKSPGERLALLREQLRGELVSFHKELLATPYLGTDLPCPEGYKLWQVGVPLTLFPKRDQGFSRVECIVEFQTADASSGAFRVLKLLPEERSELKARAEIRGMLQLDTSAKARLKVPLPGFQLANDVALELYGKAQAGPFVYESTRMCVETEVVEGRGGRWRLDDPSQPQKLGAESHQLAVIIAVKIGAPPLQAAGYLEAYSDENWLSQSLGSFWQNFVSAIRKFFKRGAPVTAYAEWKDLLPSHPT
jgi:hypothetical protein